MAIAHAFVTDRHQRLDSVAIGLPKHRDQIAPFRQGLCQRACADRGTRCRRALPCCARTERSDRMLDWCVDMKRLLGSGVEPTLRALRELNRFHPEQYCTKRPMIQVLHADRSGRRRCQSVACWKARPSLISVASANGRTHQLHADRQSVRVESRRQRERTGTKVIARARERRKRGGRLIDFAQSVSP